MYRRPSLINILQNPSGRSPDLNKSRSPKNKRNKLSSLTITDLFDVKDDEEKELPSERAARYLNNETFFQKIFRMYLGPDLDPYITLTLCKDIPTLTSVDGRRKMVLKTINIFTHRTKPKMRAGRNLLFNSEDMNVIEELIDPILPPQEISLKLVLWDKDLVSMDDLIGMSKTKITHVLEDPTTIMVIPIIYKGKQGHENITGDVEIKINCSKVKDKLKLRLEVVAVADIIPPYFGYGVKEDSSSLQRYRETLSILLIYIGVGVIYYTWCENWPLIDSFYYISLCLTLVGYENEHRFTSPYSYLFSAFYIFIGFFLTVMAFVDAVDCFSHLDSLNQTVRFMQRKTHIDLMTHTDHQGGELVLLQQHYSSGTIRSEDNKSIKKTKKPKKVRILKWWLKFSKYVPESFFAVIVLFVFGFVGTMQTTAVRPRGEEKGRQLGIMEAMFFTVDTMTKIGFGDFTPSTSFWKVFAIFFIIFSTIAMVHMVKHVVGTIASTRAHERRITLLTNAFRSKDDFEYFDEDGDGSISTLEFLIKMLSRLKLCSDQDVQFIRNAFRVIDADGSGEVDLDELTDFWLKMMEKKKK